MTGNGHLLKLSRGLAVLAALSLSLNSPAHAVDADTAAPVNSSGTGSADTSSSGSSPDSAAPTPSSADAASSPAATTDSPPVVSDPNVSPSKATPTALTPSVQPAATTLAPAKSSTPAPTTAKNKPGTPATALVLSGRIEELCKDKTATLPLVWKKMEPVRDTRLDAKVATAAPLVGKANSAQAGVSAQQAYPMDFRGTWSGNLTIYNRTFDPSRWQFDPAEANKEYKIMSPGQSGQTTITFYQRPDKSCYMEPCQVLFSSTQSMSEMSQNLNKSMGINAQQTAMFGNMQVPVIYALHLGDLTSGIGVTGNQLQSRLMKNDIKQLRPDVIEQVVVTHDSDRNQQTGKTRLSYSESVLRFTRVDANRLYLQAAAVNYRNDGKFSDKVVLYGTLNRVANAGTGGGYPAGNPFGSGLGGGGNMMDAMKQLQQMMQQMQR